MKEDQLKKIIQSIPEDDPGPSFTDGIMEFIEAREEFKLTPAILSVLKDEFLTEPPVQFSENLMASVRSVSKTPLHPIIGRKTWLIVAAVAACTLIFVFFNSHSQAAHSPNNLYFKIPVLDLSSATSGIAKFAGSIFTYLIPLSILVMADYYFRILRTAPRS
jgi:hypothetical protein